MFSALLQISSSSRSLAHSSDAHAILGSGQSDLCLGTYHYPVSCQSVLVPVVYDMMHDERLHLPLTAVYRSDIVLSN